MGLLNSKNRWRLFGRASLASWWGCQKMIWNSVDLGYNSEFAMENHHFFSKSNIFYGPFSIANCDKLPEGNRLILIGYIPLAIARIYFWLLIKSTCWLLHVTTSCMFTDQILLVCLSNPVFALEVPMFIPNTYLSPARTPQLFHVWIMLFNLKSAGYGLTSLSGHTLIHDQICREHLVRWS
jgi:hypothetical protein